MLIFIPKETHPNERRIPLLPSAADRLVKAGATVHIESGLGAPLGIQDDAYTAVGALVASDASISLSEADMILRLRKPEPATMKRMKKGALLISHLDPFNDQEIIKEAAQAGVSALCMEMIPRTTIAQKMDALSSQANLGGYVAVLLAAERSPKLFPMMMTPAGTISPARVFVIGAGVAGLQAIATAKRLGARVEAFDTRPVVEEQVASLGAKFVKVDLGETGQTKDGYAKELTEEQLQRQRDAMAKACAQADVVITTAQVFGRRAPLIVTAEILNQMKPGSVVVDMAIETGGNVEGAKLNEEVVMNGVSILGYANLPGRVPEAASQMYSSNLTNLIEHFWNKENKTFELKMDDEIIAGSLLTHEGEIIHPAIRKLLGLEQKEVS